MSDQAPTTAEAPRPATPTEAVTTASSDITADYERRRRRRRRRRSIQQETASKGTRLFLIAVIVLLLIVAVTGGEIRKSLGPVLQSARALVPFAALKSVFRLETFALIVAALILVYLMPGMEEKILRAVGLKKDKRRR